MSYSVEVHIEELLLHGFHASQRDRIGAAVEREITRLFTERGIPTSLVQSQEIAYGEAAAFRVAPNANPEDIGSQIAQAIYGGFTL
jgi:hypothetical protein